MWSLAELGGGDCGISNLGVLSYPPCNSSFFLKGSDVLSKLVDLLVMVPYSFRSMVSGGAGVDLIFSLRGLARLGGGFTKLRACFLSIRRIVCPCATMTAPF